jgi:hypothetical protein
VVRESGYDVEDHAEIDCRHKELETGIHKDNDIGNLKTKTQMRVPHPLVEDQVKPFKGFINSLQVAVGSVPTSTTIRPLKITHH